MNDSLLNNEIQDYINTHLSTDISKLIFKGSPFKNCTIQEIAEQIESKKKCKTKLPTWFNTKNIYYPNKLNIEQTSSQITAEYKANMISGDTLIDLTGGFGVDCFHFSKTFKNITHCEINKSLSEIVNHNFRQLSNKNTEIINGNGLKFLRSNKQKYDWIYVDPSRRSDSKEKVFLLKDCLPNVPENIDLLFEFSNNILIKNSPILDIKSAINELKYVKEIHIVAVKNEVKELLFLLEKDYTGLLQIKTTNIIPDKNQYFNFKFGSTKSSEYHDPKKYLYEPNAAILKSGGFHEVSNQLNVFKLHQHSHLYTSDFLIDFPGRRFIVEHCITPDKKSLKKLIPTSKSNITTRNYPLSVSEIRKKYKIKDGGNQYLFFTTNLHNKLVVLICEKV